MAKIHIENVCNIKKADIEIVDNKLNIKFGTNGTGKSSIVKAIRTHATKDEKEKKNLLSLITPYNALENESPIIEAPYKSIRLFDPEYVDNFLFKEDELYKDSYSIIINNSDTKALRDKIDNTIDKGLSPQTYIRLNRIKDTLNQNIGWNNENNKSGIIDGKKILAPFKKGNILRQYQNSSPYIDYLNKQSWVNFAQSGMMIINNEHQCPFCLNKIDDEHFEEIEKILDFFNKKNVDKYLKNMTFIKENIYRYSSKDDQKIMDDIFDKKEEINVEDAHILKEKFDKVQNEFNKLTIINELSKISLTDINNVLYAKENIASAYLDSSIFFEKEDIEACEEYNLYVKEVEKSIDRLYELNVELNQKLQDSIEENKNFINSFLENSGMKYRVDIDKEEQKIILRPEGIINKKINSPKDHLSYGERNSLSLMLFALEIKSSDTDLIVLDDPISSFDINKKFAIFYQLFDKDIGIFKDRTVLMLTHEFSIVIDALMSEMFIDNLPELENNPFAIFIRNNNGLINEDKITKEDIKSSEALDKFSARDISKSRIVRACHIRRYIEMNYMGNNGPYKIISSFLHCSPNPTYSKTVLYDSFKLKEAEDCINEVLNLKEDPFNYYEWMNRIDEEKIKEDFKNADSSLDKIFITRFYAQYLKAHPSLNKSNIMNQSIYNFICSNYHIENDSLMRLLEKYDTIPSYIIDACEKFFQN